LMACRCGESGELEANGNADALNSVHAHTPTFDDRASTYLASDSAAAGGKSASARGRGVPVRFMRS
jgi:hypothetical protein